MYKKCDIMVMDSISEIIKREVERIKIDLDLKLFDELLKYNIKTTKPKYLKGWLTRKRLIVHMIVDGLDTTVRVVSRDKPLCGRGEVIKAGLKATSLVGMSDCILKVTERAYNNVSVSDRIHIEQSANIRRIDIEIVKE